MSERAETPRRRVRRPIAPLEWSRRTPGRIAALGFAAAMAACASTPPASTASPAQPDEEEEHVFVNEPPPQPMVEYPPIEPVEPPEIVGPSPTPAPAIAAPPSAPAAAPPVTIVAPVVTPPAAPSAEPPAPAPVPVPEPSADEQQMNLLLADLNRYALLSADDVRREIAAGTLALSRQRTDHNRIRLAVLYTLARTPADDQRALQLFDNVLKGNAANGVAVKALASVLQLQVAERVRAVRDEQRKGEVAVQKLEALREMERSLLRDRIRSGGGGGGGGGGGSAGH